MTSATAEPSVILHRLDEVKRISGLSRSTIYERVADGSFPRPYRISRNLVGWRSDELQEWMDGLDPAGPEPEADR